jgi:hypothetical protein
MKKITLLMTLVFSSSLMFAQVLSEDFEAGLTLPTGWTINDIAGGGDVWAFATGGEAVGYAPPNTLYYDDGLLVGNYALLDSDGFGNNAIAEETALESPAFDVSGASNVILSFNHFFTAGYGGQGFVEVFNGTTWVQVASYTGASQTDSSFGLEEIVVSTELSGVSNAQVRFRWVGDYAWGWAVDNVSVSAPTCIDPAGFVLGPNGITTTSVDIAWTDANGAGTVFDIEWGLDGFTPGSGTMVNDLTATNYDFTGLMPDTVYDFYITANCTGGNGDSAQVGPIGFATAFDCSTYGLPYSEDWSNLNAYFSCYTIEDTNVDGLSWTFNDVNDLNGDMTVDNIVNIFPQAANVAKDDWLFTPAISGTLGGEYTVTVTYNAVDFQGTANESFDLVITDTPSSAATTQSVIGSYNSITQAGVFGDTGGNDLITQAYTSTATYIPTADGDFHVAIHANTPAAGSDVFFFLTIEVTETLSIDDFEQNTFTHNYDKVSETLNIESSNIAMTNVEIYSLLGQNVISRPLSSTSESIDVSSLNDGVYLAKINIDDNFKTIKFVKN